MSKEVDKLSDLKCRTAKYNEDGKGNKLSDGAGLYLELSETGSKLWRMRYRFNNKEKLLAIGKYPAITLAKAREIRDEARDKLASNIDPSAHKQEEKQKLRNEERTLTDVFNEWHNNIKELNRKTDKVIEKDKSYYLRDIEPFIGNMPIIKIEKKDIIECIKRIDSRSGSGSATKKATTMLRQVYDYALTFYNIENIARNIVFNTVLPSKSSNKMAHLTCTKEFAQLLLNIDNYSGTIWTKNALKLAPLLFLRPGNIQKLEWSEVCADKQYLKIPASKMKMRNEFIQPLSVQALAIIEEMRPLSGNGRYVFPLNGKIGSGRPISENALRSALVRLDYGGVQTAHGFRHIARTILGEHQSEHGCGKEILEVALAHTVGGVEGVYNEAKYVKERTKLMQWWADYLDNLKKNS